MAASDIIAEVAAPVMGLPVFVAGSLVAEETYGLDGAHDDADLFCRTRETLIKAATLYEVAGYELADRGVRAMDRWMQYGFGKWHTNSVKLTHPTTGVEVNLVYKLQGGNPVDSLAAVLESFDFGLLGVGYDLSNGLIKRDMRSFLFPTVKDLDGPLPLMPNKRHAWRQGLISQYNGIRESGRYAKYAQYGYDMSLVKDDLVTGYYEAAAYYTQHDDEQKQLLGRIMETSAILIEDDEIDKLREAGKEILFMDELDQIMEALE